MDQMKPTGTLKPRNFETFEWPPSIQQDLWNYLKPEQQEQMKPILRVLKKPAQCELCCSLLDYMEQGEATPPADLTLAAMYMYLTRVGIGEDMEKAIIKPLTSREVSRASAPKHIRDIVDTVFGKCFQN